MDLEQYNYPDLKPFDQDWRWCHKYCYQVLNGDVPACKTIKQAAQRHFNDLQRDDIYFDEEAAKSIVLWFKFIPITDGKDAGKPTILLPWQIFVVVSLIAWKWSSTTFDDDGNELTVSGLRRFNQAFILISRKSGKTTLAAGIMLYLMHKAGFQPRAYSLATKKDQAKLLWNTAKIMIRLSPRLQSIFESRANEILMPNKEGEFKALASDANSLDGLNPITASLDECHAVKNRNLYGVIISAFGAQIEYLMITITTAGFILDGLCTDLYKNGCRVLDPDDDAVQDNYFYAIFQLDKGDDWTDKQSWYKSNAGLVYGLPKMKYLNDRLAEAMMSIEEKANFLTKHCNMFVSGTDKWLDMDLVKECKVSGLNEKWEEYKNRKCYIAIDRARVNDITSIPILFPDDDGGITIFFLNLLPMETLKKVSDYLRSVYNKAVDAGDLTLVTGSIVRDHHVIEELERLWHELPNCEGIYYDPWKMREVCETLAERNIPTISVSQGTGNMSEPAKKLEGLLIDRLVRYESVLFEYACSCAMMNMTRKSNMDIFRENDKVDKIDPLIATIIALSGATLFSVEQNIYESRGMISV